MVNSPICSKCYTNNSIQNGSSEGILSLLIRNRETPDFFWNIFPHNFQVIDISTFFEREAGMVQLNVVDPSWLVFSGGFDYSTPRRLSKRFAYLLTPLCLAAEATNQPTSLICTDAETRLIKLSRPPSQP